MPFPLTAVNVGSHRVHLAVFRAARLSAPMLPVLLVFLLLPGDGWGVRGMEFYWKM